MWQERQPPPMLIFSKSRRSSTTLYCRCLLPVWGRWRPGDKFLLLSQLSALSIFSFALSSFILCLSLVSATHHWDTSLPHFQDQVGWWNCPPTHQRWKITPGHYAYHTNYNPRPQPPVCIDGGGRYSWCRNTTDNDWNWEGGSTLAALLPRSSFSALLFMQTFPNSFSHKTKTKLIRHSIMTRSWCGHHLRLPPLHQNPFNTKQDKPTNIFPKIKYLVALLQG